jgi:uncharacterized protein
MKFLCAIIGVLCLSGGAIAQTPSTTAPQHQPGVTAPSAPTHTPGQTAKKAPSDSADKPDPAKDEAIRHLMDITGTSKLGDNIAAYLKDQVKEGAGRAIGADKVDAFMVTFNQKFLATSPGTSVTDAMVPIYAKAFSMEDIQGLIQFYESPLGQRVVKALPDVTQESQKVGIEIEQTAALNILRGMSEQYPELKQILPPENGGAPAPGGAAPQGAGPSPAPTPSK